MKFMVLKEVITPDIPVLQFGFAARTHKSEGVHDDVYAHVVWLEGDETCVIIMLDLIGGDLSFAAGIRQAIYERFGIPGEQVVVSYTHSHSIVAITGEDRALAGNRVSIAAENFGYDDDDSGMDYTEDLRYYRTVRDIIIDMIGRCKAEAADGDIYINKGVSRFGVSRRKPSPDGGVLWEPYDCDAARDTDLYVLKLCDKSGNIRAIIYNYACHPTSLGPDNYLISADYPGAVAKRLEARYPGAVAVFLQGCGADIKPFQTGITGLFRSISFDELETEGEQMSNDVISLLDADGWRKLDGTVRIKTETVKLYCEPWPRERWADMASDPNESPHRKKSARKNLKRYDDGTVTHYLPYTMSCLKLDESVCIVTLPCEVVNAIGKRIKSLFADGIITLGYTNNVSCYIPTRRVSEEGGYEAKTFIGAGVTGPFVHETEDIIVGHAAAMIQSF